METQWSNALTILRNFGQTQEGEQEKEQAQEEDENLAETNADAHLAEDVETDDPNKLSVHSDEQKDHSRTMRNSAIAYWRYGHEKCTSEPTCIARDGQLTV